jgi:hypothetical protein
MDNMNNLTWKNDPGAGLVVHACNLSYDGGIGGRIRSEASARPDLKTITKAERQTAK